MNAAYYAKRIAESLELFAGITNDGAENMNMMGFLKRIDDASTQLAASGGVAMGTVFPTPSTNLRFFRTDKGREYFYDGTRWLSLQQFSLVFPQALSQVDGLSVYAANPWMGLENMWLEDLSVAMANSTVTSANYYTAQLQTYSDANIVNVGEAISGQNDTQSQMKLHTLAIDTAIASTIPSFRVTYTEVGVANASLLASINFRLTAT
jgi:hypothetical protein